MSFFSSLTLQLLHCCLAFCEKLHVHLQAHLHCCYLLVLVISSANLAWMLWCPNSQWKERNSRTNGVDLKASQALQRKHAQQQITTAYHNKSSISCDKQSFTFGIPFTDRLLQPTSLLNTWLLQYQAGQHQLANQLKTKTTQPMQNHKISHSTDNRTTPSYTTRQV